MIGWALRWAFVCGAIAVLCGNVLGGDWWRPHERANFDLVRASRQAEAAPDIDTSTFPSDGQGHVFLDAVVNGAPVRFLLDTGATLVTLTPDDARAAGFSPGQLEFKGRIRTANGEVSAATIKLREIRFGEFAIADVPAAIVETVPISLLGMSFLSRLKSYAMRDGKLTISW